MKKSENARAAHKFPWSRMKTNSEAFEDLWARFITWNGKFN